MCSQALHFDHMLFCFVRISLDHVSRTDTILRNSHTRVCTEVYRTTAQIEDEILQAPTNYHVSPWQKDNN